MSAVPFVLVTGFLGSGKTTLLKRFLHQFADAQKIAVIQNEFAPANIDGKELETTGKPFHILEINRGSVFCVCLLSDFTKSLNELIDEVKPDAVILEATGLADPVAVGEVLQADELNGKIYLAHVLCVVDVSTYSRVAKSLQRVRQQIRTANTVVLNKLDIFSGDLAEVERDIRLLNPFANIIGTTFCDIQMGDLLNELPNATAQNRKGGPAIKSSGRPDLGSAVIRSNKNISLNNLELFLKQHESGAYRLKGFVNLNNGKAVAIQSCFGETTITELRDYVGPTELIAIGPEINARNFSQQFRALAE